MLFIDLLLISLAMSLIVGIVTLCIEGNIVDALLAWLGSGAIIAITGLVVLGVNAYLLARGY